MIKQFDEIERGDVIKDSNFKNREKYSWYNNFLNRVEFCPKRAITVHTEESFEECFASGKEEDPSAGEAEYIVYDIQPKSMYAKRLPEKKEKIHIFRKDFPQLEVLRREKIAKQKSKPKKRIRRRSTEITIDPIVIPWEDGDSYELADIFDE